MDISNISNSIDENLNIGKELEKNKQIEIFDSNQISTDSRLLQQNEDEEHRKKQASVNLLSNKQVGAGDEISQVAARVLAQKKLEEAQSPEEIRRLLGEFAGKDVNQLESEQKKQWIQLIRNSEFLNGDENKKIRELIDMFLFLLQNQPKENQAEVVQNKDDLQRVKNKLVADTHYFENSHRGVDLTKLKELMQSFIGAEREIQHPAGNQDEVFSEFEEKQKAFFQQIEQSPLYDEGDKLLRKREYYLAYSKKILQGERNPQATDLNKIKFRCDLDRIEKELADYIQKKELVETHKKLLEEVIDVTTDGETKSRAERTLANLKALSAYRKNCADTRYKNQLIALDEKKENRERWDADETLHENQKTKVRELDQWLLEHEPKAVKDKCFIAQFMGCTVRERLAMYLCVEMNNKNVDESLLTFSQMNYEPDATLIKKNLKSFFGDGVHWSKMRKAYEFITSQSAALDSVIEKVEKYKLDPMSSFAEDEIRTGSQFTKAPDNLVDVDERIKAISNRLLEGLRVPAKKDDESKNKEPNNQVLEGEQLEEEQNNQVIANVNQQETLTPDEIKDLMKQLRGYAKRKAELEKNPVLKRIFKQITRGLDYYSYVSMVHTGGDLAMGIARTLGGGKPAGMPDIVDVYADRTDFFMATFATPIVNSLKYIQSLYNLSQSVDASNLTIAKNASGAFQSGFTMLDSLETAISDISHTGAWEDRYREYRETIANKMKDRANQGLGAAKFDLELPHTYFQMLSTATTACSTVFDYIQTSRSGKACKTIREQIATRREERQSRGELHADMKDATYRQEHYKLSMTKLVDRINSRRKYTAGFNAASNLNGYLKYCVPVPYVGLISSGVGITISICSKLVDHFKKKNSNNKTVDEFLNLDGMMREYRENNPGVNIGDENKFRERLRRNAMLQLGFANSKTFLAHVMQKLAEMMYRVLSNASKSNDRGVRDEAKPIKTIVESLGLAVNFTKHRIPKAKQIAAKLAI